jgi:serine phosphatase RsbU (regulator of sigma subunit)
VTAAYVYVDLEKNLLRYGGAGHPPLMQFRPSTGIASKILENGLVLGIFEEADYQALEIPLEPGDRHVLYTDGILEAANSAEEMYGGGRFAAFLEANRSLKADPFADSFLAEIGRFTAVTGQHSQQDDITLLLFDFKPS